MAFLNPMRNFVLTILFLATGLAAFCQVTDPQKQKPINDFINVIKLQDKEALANLVKFPLKRESPLPAITSKEELIARYDEVFDKGLIKLISGSQPEKDWTEMGWRGFMLQRGTVWLSGEGKLIAVNYQSVIEKRKSKSLIKDDKRSLYGSVKKFKRPSYLLETAKFRIRIDDTGDGNYRYTSWSLQRKLSDKPDLVIENGKFIAEGSGGNHRYEFRNADYVYDCSFTVMGTGEEPPAELKIYKGGKEILSAPATIIR